MGVTAVVSAAGLALGLAVTGVTGVAVASGAAPQGLSVHRATAVAKSGPAGGEGERLRSRMAEGCARVPKRIDRVQSLIARVDGDASTKGSLDFLTARIERAKQRGDDDIAAILEARMKLRTQLAQVLPDRLELLQQAQQACDAADLPSVPAPSAT